MAAEFYCFYYVYLSGGKVKQRGKDITTETSGSYWLSAHEQEAFAPILGHAGIVPAVLSLAIGRWWHLMPPAAPEAMPADLHIAS